MYTNPSRRNVLLSGGSLAGAAALGLPLGVAA
jgi:hypothetical protein